MDRVFTSQMRHQSSPRSWFGTVLGLQGGQLCLQQLLGPCTLACLPGLPRGDLVVSGLVVQIQPVEGPVQVAALAGVGGVLVVGGAAQGDAAGAGVLDLPLQGG